VARKLILQAKFSLKLIHPLKLSTELARSRYHSWATCTKIGVHSNSESNLTFSRRKLKTLLFICVEISLYLKNYALLSVTLPRRWRHCLSYSRVFHTATILRKQLHVLWIFISYSQATWFQNICIQCLSTTFNFPLLETKLRFSQWVISFLSLAATTPHRRFQYLRR